MSTIPTLPLDNLPHTLRTPLLEALNSIVRNFREKRWEPSELNGGKLCEVVYTILRGHIDGRFPSKPSKPPNMVDACKRFEVDGKTFGRSISIQIPRMLVSLYEVRNNRGVGHVGGDVNPNHMDAVLVVSMSKWLVAELIRFFHNVDTATATEAVEALTDKTIPLVWSIGDTLRVLNPTLPMRDKALVLLYSVNGWVSEDDLRKWVEHSNGTAFRRDVLKVAHRDRLLEYDESQRRVHISPKGIKYLEEKIPLEIV